MNRIGIVRLLTRLEELELLDKQFKDFLPVNIVPRAVQ